MRALLIFAALLFAASTQLPHALQFRHVPMHEGALQCDTLEELRGVITAAERGGISASDAHLRRINEAARLAGKQPCKLIFLDPLLQMRAIEGYAAVESMPGQLRNIVVLEVVGRDGKTRYDAIARVVARGYTI